MTDLREKILSRLGDYRTYREIADELGSTPASVKMIVCRMRQDGLPVPDYLRVQIHPARHGRLRAAAMARGLQTQVLAARILDAAIASGEIDKLLGEVR